MRDRLPAESYKTVSIALSGEAYAVLLDGKPAKVGAAALRVPQHALAEAVAQEWRERGKHRNRDTMRLTRLVGHALNRVVAHRGDAVEHILGFGRNELLCYRTAEPAELAARQKEIWDPLLEWIHRRYAIRLVSDCGTVSSSSR